MIKKIEAIIRREKLDEVKEALEAIGIVGMSVLELRGRGRSGGMLVHGRTGDYVIDLLPKIMIMIILSDHNVEVTVQTIKKAAYTGDAGDGVIFVYPVENVYRISSDEEGHDAIMYQGDIDTRQKPAGT